MTRLTRRRFLRGTLAGTSVVVGMPFLDCFLNDHGTALAATGTALPVCFGTWFQSMGINPGFWVPKTTGPNYENNANYGSIGALKGLDRFKDRTNIFSGLKYFLDNRPHQTHTTGPQIATTGGIPQGTIAAPSVDSLIADVIGTKTRFRSLEVSLSGSQKSWSQRSGSAVNPSEGSPVALYTRLFGADFRDPNVAEFKPDPLMLARKSVLSAITDERQSVMRQLGAADRVRFEEYFTTIREMEGQLAMSLEKPAPLEACVVPTAPNEAKPGTVVEAAEINNRLFAKLLAHALACGQTRVFNVIVDSETMHKAGSAVDWHMLSHEEPVDPRLGYQPEVTWFINWANTMFAEFLHTLDDVREGPGTVLDRLVILWQTDHSDAKSHSLENVPVMTVGRAGGRIKTGIHISAPGDPVTRVGLTVQQALGVPTQSWGEISNATSKTMTEIVT